jgi:hypothetical protein
MADPGELKWQAPITGLGFACPSVAADGTIMYATHTNGGVLYAIDPVDGTILRQTQLPGTVEHAAALGDNDEVFFNTFDQPLPAAIPRRPSLAAGTSTPSPKSGRVRSMEVPTPLPFLETTESISASSSIPGTRTTSRTALITNLRSVLLLRHEHRGSHHRHVG